MFMVPHQELGCLVAHRDVAPGRLASGPLDGGGHDLASSTLDVYVVTWLTASRLLCELRLKLESYLKY